MVSYFLTATYAVIVYMLIREVYNNDGIQLPLKVIEESGVCVCIEYLWCVCVYMYM